MKHVLRSLLALTLLAGPVPSVLAQSPPPGMIPCARMADGAQRLRCYDAQMVAMGVAVATAAPAGGAVRPPIAAPDTAVASTAAPPSSPVATPAPQAQFGQEDIKPSKRGGPASDKAVASLAGPPPAAVAPTSAPSPEAKFGAEDLKGAERPKENKEDRLLLSTITSIKEVRPKLFIIVLANGQIWMQEGTQITSFFKAGFDARIEKGLLGDYRMATTQTGVQNMVRVTRIH